jgi:hypothetical protein
MARKIASRNRTASTAYQDMSGMTVKPTRTIPKLPHEHIEARAFHIYLSRGAAHGQDLSDWLQAERELLAGH